MLKKRVRKATTMKMKVGRRRPRMLTPLQTPPLVMMMMMTATTVMMKMTAKKKIQMRLKERSLNRRTKSQKQRKL